MDLLVVIAPSIITGLVSLLVCVITQAAGRKQTEALITYRLTELEKKVDKHNQLVERVFILEGRTDVQEEKISVANHRIEDLEKKMP